MPEQPRNVAQAIARVDHTISLVEQQLESLHQLRYGLIGKFPCPTCNARVGTRCRVMKVGRHRGEIRNAPHASREKLALEN